MKKLISAFLSIVLVVVMIPAMGVSAVTEGYYTYTVTNDEATITGVNTSISGDIVIPDTLGGYPVTEIGNQSFSNCSKLTSVTIPNSVTIIGYGAFESCKSITSVTIPDSVISIDSGAFGGCTNLTGVYITDLAAWCSIIFDGSIYFPNLCWDSNPIFYAKKLYLNGQLLTDIIIPDGVTSIGNGVFNNCESITNITIPDSVTNIGSSAFEGCTNLTSITIPDSVTNIASRAFKDCTNLLNIAIPESVTSIGSSAFEGCTSFTNITFPESITSIGCGALSGCKNLNNITIPFVGNTKEGTDHTWFAYIFGENNSPSSSSYSPLCIPTSLEEVTITGGTKIDKYAFYKCLSIKSITLPNTIISIGNNAFEGCTTITSIIIPDNVSNIDTRAFYNCKNLINITIPDSVASIDSSAFILTGYYNDQSNWEEGMLYIGKHFVNAKRTTSDEYAVTIKDGTVTIANYVFEDFSNLTSVTIPGSVKSIGLGAFYGCTKLVNITIPENAAIIGDYAFCGCTNLTNITISKNVANIGWYAFAGCTSLTNVFYEGSKEEWDEMAIRDGNTYLTSVKYLHYNTLDPNNHFVHIVTKEPNCTENGESAYICSCGYSKDESDIPALGHDTVQHDGKSPTCTEIGYIAYETCTRCDYTNYKELPANGHSLIQHSAKAPSCTDIGWNAYETCRNCDYTTYFELRKYGHQYENGLCIHCGENEAVVFTYGDATGDGKINLADVSLMLKYIAKWNVELDTDAADVTCDDKVNLADVSLILKYIAKWDVILGK